MKAILIDGYVPQIEGFRSVDWSGLRRDGSLPRDCYKNRIYPVLRVDRAPTERRLLKVFGNAVEGLRSGLCPCDEETWYARRCVYTVWTTGDNYYSIEKTTLPRELGKHVSTLYREYEHDRGLGRHNYIQNTVIHDTETGAGCSDPAGCCENWIERLGFRVKDEADYRDVTAFSDSWRSVLEDDIERFREELGAFDTQNGHYCSVSPNYDPSGCRRLGYRSRPSRNSSLDLPD